MSKKPLSKSPTPEVKKPAKGKSVESEIMIITNSLPVIESVTILNDDQFEASREQYKMISKIESEITLKKKAILDPLNTAISEVKALFKAPERRIAQLREVLSLGLGKYANDREIARLRALEKINADQRIKSINTLQDKREAVGDRIGGTMKTKRLVIDEPDRIPNEFWVIDEALLKKALIGGREIKGARIVEELTVTSR